MPVEIDFEKMLGLAPVIVQDASTGEVLMLGFMNQQALEATLKALQEKVASLTCPIHHQSPKLKTSEGAGPGKQNMFFDCCCDTLKKIMEEALKS